MGGFAVIAAGIIFMLVYALWNRAMAGTWRRERGERRRREFGSDPSCTRQYERSRELLEEIAVYYEETKETLSEGNVDEVTWNDLEMDEVFLRINRTESYIGEQVLYRRLHQTAGQEAAGEEESNMSGAAGGCGLGSESKPTGEEESDRTKAGGSPSPAGAAEWDRFEQRLRYLTENGNGRERLQEALSQIGKTREDYYLPVFLKNADILRVEHLWLYRTLQAVLIGSFLLGMLTRHPLALVLLIAAALVNFMIYIYSKAKYEIYLYALGSVKQMLRFHSMLEEDRELRELFVTERQSRAAADLRKLMRYIGSFQRKKAGALTGDAFDLLRDYLIGITLWDITAFARIARILEGKENELFLLYEACGEIDMQIAVASFRKSLPDFCLPASDGGEGFLARGLYHPLLSDPVHNDFAPRGNVMITGANASGKSTFLKAVAVNAILAQSIHTAAAETFSMPHLWVMTSMAVRDDLLGGESYYIREVRYLKRIIDAVRRGRPVLCVIDEILRGTNTKERLAASEAVCRYLLGRPGLVLVATHDLELAQTLDGIYENYCFQSSITGEDIVFDYRIYPGTEGGQNAIRLLAHMDFPEEIVAMAERLHPSDPAAGQGI